MPLRRRGNSRGRRNRRCNRCARWACRHRLRRTCSRRPPDSNEEPPAVADARSEVRAVAAWAGRTSRAVEGRERLARASAEVPGGLSLEGIRSRIALAAAIAGNKPYGDTDIRTHELDLHDLEHGLIAQHLPGSRPRRAVR